LPNFCIGKPITLDGHGAMGYLDCNGFVLDSVSAPGAIAIRAQIKGPIGLESDCIMGWGGRHRFLIIAVQALLPLPFYSGNVFRVRRAAGKNYCLRDDETYGNNSAQNRRLNQCVWCHITSPPLWLLEKAFIDPLDIGQVRKSM